MQIDDGGGLLLGVACVGQGFVGQDQVVLPAVDVVLDFVGTIVPGIFLLHDVGEQRFDIAVIEDREAGLVAHPRVFLADDVHAQVVEGGHGQAACLGALEQAADALLHLARGLVGEGHGDDVAGLDAAMLHQIGDLAGDHAGLAGAGTGEHQKWAADVVHGFLLPRVESGHGVQVIRSGGGSLTGCRADAGPLQVQ